MNVNEILENPVESITTDEIKNVFDQMKEKNFFDLDNKQRLNLKESAIDYLFHVLDNEISYPIDDEKVKILFDDDRMKKMKDLMVEQLQDEETVDVSDED
jgi:hypothetical protein